VLPEILPKPEELVAQNRDAGCIAQFLLARAERHCTYFGPKDPAARGLFVKIVEAADASLRSNPELQLDVFTALLKPDEVADQRQETLKQRQEMLDDFRWSDEWDAIRAEKKDVPEKVLEYLLDRMAEAVGLHDATKIKQKLRGTADEYHELQKRLEKPRKRDSGYWSLRAFAAGWIADARFEEVDKVFSDEEKKDLDSLKELEATARALRIGAAETRVDRAEVAKLQLDYHKSAEHYRHAEQLWPEEDFFGRWRLRMGSAQVLRLQDEEFEDSAALTEAIALYRSALDLVPHERAPLEWAATQNDLGNALRSLGERESGTERLVESAEAYSNALKEWRRDKAPHFWECATNNLDIVKQLLETRRMH